MKKRKVFVRIILLLFLIAVPIYLLKSAYFSYKINSSKKSKQKQMLTGDLRKNFITRKEKFFEDKNYKLAIKKLEKEKLEVEGVVIVE